MLIQAIFHTQYCYWWQQQFENIGKSQLKYRYKKFFEYSLFEIKLVCHFFVSHYYKSLFLYKGLYTQMITHTQYHCYWQQQFENIGKLQLKYRYKQFCEYSPSKLGGLLFLVKLV
jgi:hypothetical protein